VVVVVVGVGLQGFFISALAGVSFQIKIKTAGPHTTLEFQDRHSTDDDV